MSECLRCTAPAADMFLCSTCGIALRIELRDVPDLLADLDITRSRQDQLAAPYDKGPGSGEQPLPFKPHVAEVVWVLHDTLTAWSRHLGLVVTPRATTGELALSLLRNLDLIRADPEADHIADEATSAIHQARRAIDRPNDRRLFLGPCGNTTSDGECREELYGLPWHRTATCPVCEAEYNIEARQDWMHQVAHNHLGTAPEIAGFLRMTGVRCTPEMIRGYAARGRLAAAGRNPQDHPLYRISDVLQALHERYQHRKAG